MKIIVQDAQLNTVNVEVKAITLNGKQMTLSVFRQLEDKELNEDAVVWGRVNYHPDKKCSDTNREHVHVIWQDKGTLFRHTLYHPGEFNFDLNFKHMEIADAFALLGFMNIHERYASTGVIKFEDFSAYFDIHVERSNIWTFPVPSFILSNDSEKDRKIRTEVCRLYDIGRGCEMLGISPGEIETVGKKRFEELKDQVVEVYASGKIKYDEKAELYQSILNAQQLFIAV